jgi:hypothetical protein
MSGGPQGTAEEEVQVRAAALRSRTRQQCCDQAKQRVGLGNAHDEAIGALIVGYAEPRFGMYFTQ